MRYAIYSDIHGNLEAFQAVLSILDEERIDQHICLGDIVGYGANPRECLQLVVESKAIVVGGNHDYAVAGNLTPEFFNQYAREAVIWSQKQLSESEKKYLASLDLVQQLNDEITIVHSTLHFPEMFNYIQTSHDAHITLQLMETPICFIGHSHVPISFFLKSRKIAFSMDEEIPIDKRQKTLINVGSVGQPRDDNPLACFAIYDDEIEKVWIYRVEYDIDMAVEKIERAGLPSILGERLKLGR